MLVYAFTAIISDDSDWLSSHNIKYYRESGFGLANSLSEAAAQLEERYGRDLESIIKLQLFDEENLIIVSEKTVQEYTHADYDEYQIPCDIEGTILKKEKTGK